MKLSIPKRANRILHIVIVVMLLVLVRVWHLSVVQHKEKVEEARRPQRRVRIEQAQRGTIRDRFNVPFAVNRVQYNAAILYAQIREMPRTERKRHIQRLSELLAEELNMAAERVEDLIHSKAALFPNVPFVIKADVSEKVYFRVKMLEREWLGLHAERVPKRSYPQGAVAGEILGYLGAISPEKYEAIVSEITTLKRQIQEAEEGVALPEFDLLSSRRRLAELQERAYSIHDQIGKAGVEAVFDKDLRGYCGKALFLQDIYGSFVRPLPGGRSSVSGQRVLLTLSAELQRYAEQLLCENEEIREGRSHEFDRESGVYHPLKQPWIKGGAIVVMEPNTGEILALASYPRSDPNNFVKDADHWFETERYIGAIWDGKRPLERECFQRGKYRQDAIDLTWERYLASVYPKDFPITTVRDAIEYRGDDVLVSDLCNLVVDAKRFSPALLKKVGDQRLSTYRKVNQAAIVVADAARGMAKRLFHEEQFTKWRANSSKAFLREKRREEEEKETYQRPYLDYLDQAEEGLFADFWKAYSTHLIHLFLSGETPLALPKLYEEHFGQLAKEWQEGAHRFEPWSAAYRTLREAIDLPWALTIEYLQTMRSFSDLTDSLDGDYRFLRGKKQKDLAAVFYPRYGFGFSRSLAFRQDAPQGSVFKIVTAYEALIQRYNKGHASLNPLTMVDDVHRSRTDSSKWNIGFDLLGKPIPQRYKGGSLLRTHRRHVGQIDLIGAIEASSNSYFGLLAADHIDDPNDLAEAARLFSYGSRTGVTLPGEYGGYVSEDLQTNRTGLYTFVDGQHSMVVTPLQTAVMLSAIVNGGKVFKPQLMHLMAGFDPDRNIVFNRQHFAFQDTLSLMGVNFPLFTSRNEHLKKSHYASFSPEIRRTIPLPENVRNILLTGMQRVVSGEKGGGRPSVIRAYANYPWMIADYRQLQNQIVGKSGTAERVENIGLDETHIYNHIWFACASFEPDQISEGRFGKPELVVIVYLRYGDYGREAAPLATQMIKKWREIKDRH